MTGSGTTVLAGSNNTYTTTPVSAGATLALGGVSPGAFGILSNATASGLITNGGTINFAETGTLLFNRTDFTYAATVALGGTGSFFQTGTGTTTLGGLQVFKGILGTKAGVLVLSTTGTYSAVSTTGAFTTSLQVQGGTMTLPANSGINFNTDQLFLSGAGKFDLAGNALTIPLDNGTSGSVGFQGVIGTGGSFTNSSTTSNMLTFMAGPQFHLGYPHF